MALAETLSIAAFYDLLRIDANGLKFGLDFLQQRAMTGGGVPQVSDRAPAMLSAEITTIPVTNAEAEGIMALLNSRAGGIKSFLLTNPRLPYPVTDPTGALLGSETPDLATITDRLHVAFTGFPAGYVIPRGTYFGVVFNTSRYYLGQFCEAKTADGSGNVTTTEICPPLPASISSGAISLKKPPAKFQPIAGTAFISQEDGTRARVTFSAEQTYG
jgi:hypothetical protein